MKCEIYKDLLLNFEDTYSYTHVYTNIAVKKTKFLEEVSGYKGELTTKFYVNASLTKITAT